VFQELSKKSVVVGVIFTLSACSGSGDGTSPAPAAEKTYPVASAMVSRLTSGMEATVDIAGRLAMSGSLLTVNGSGTFGSSILTNATFFEQPAMSVVETFSGSLSATPGGAPLPASFMETIYFDSNYNELGYTREDNFTIFEYNKPYTTVVTELHPFPDAAKVNDIGPLNKTTTYTDSTKTTVYHTGISTYAIEADTSTSVILHISTKFYGADDVLTQTEEERYRITAAGNISFVSFEAAAADGSMDVSFSAH